MPRIPSLSLLQMMKAVAFAAVAFACVAPLLRTWQMGAINGGAQSGLIAIAIFGGVAIPVAWTGLAVLLIRRGAWRDQLVTSFLLCSVWVALCFALWTFAAFSVPMLWHRFVLESITTALLSLVIFGVLGVAWFFLARRLWMGYRSSQINRPGAQPGAREGDGDNFG